MTVVNALLIAILSVSSLSVMFIWHFKVRGNWLNYSSGRAVMALLGMICAITGLAALNIIVGIPGSTYVYAVMYSILLLIIGYVATIILQVEKRDRRDGRD